MFLSAIVMMKNRRSSELGAVRGVGEAVGLRMGPPARSRMGWDLEDQLWPTLRIVPGLL